MLFPRSKGVGRGAVRRCFRHRRHGICILILFIAGCRNLPEPGPGATLLEIPAIHQAPDHCGPAALHAVYRYWGWTGTEAEVAARVFNPEEEGTLPGMLVADARQQGFSSVLGGADPVQWARALSRGVPVICLQPGRTGHFVVLQGHGGPRFLVNDGSGRLRWTAGRDLAPGSLVIYVWPGDYAFDPPPVPFLDRP